MPSLQKRLRRPYEGASSPPTSLFLHNATTSSLCPLVSIDTNRSFTTATSDSHHHRTECDARNAVPCRRASSSSPTLCPNSNTDDPVAMGELSISTMHRRYVEALRAKCAVDQQDDDAATIDSLYPSTEAAAAEASPNVPSRHLLNYMHSEEQRIGQIVKFYRGNAKKMKESSEENGLSPSRDAEDALWKQEEDRKARAEAEELRVRMEQLLEELELRRVIGLVKEAEAATVCPSFLRALLVALE